jgi:polyisoprenoid-binding protein YceI
MAQMRFAVLALPALFSLASLTACEDPAKDAPRATVQTAAPHPSTEATHAATAATAATPANVPALAGAENLPLDATSSVGFVGSKVTGKHEGKFEKVTGTVSLVGGKIEGGRIAIDVDVSSVKTDQEKLDGHLKSPDFFDVAKFPKATFTSSEIKAGGDKGATDTITGELDLHGEKKVLTFPATVTVTADGVSGTAEFVINRKDFKIIYPGKPDDLIRDDVVLKLSLKAPRKK